MEEALVIKGKPARPAPPTLLGRYNDVAARIWCGVATEPELDAIGLDNVRAIKSDSEHLNFRGVVTRKPKTADAEQRTVEYVLSTEEVDRMGDLIKVSGWDLSEAREHCPFLRYHKDWVPPLGGVEKFWKDRIDDNVRALLGLVRVFADDKQDAEGKVLARLVLDGDMPAGSVGFIPLTVHFPDTPEERAELGLGKYGVVFEECTLLEFSAVNVPANASAMQRSAAATQSALARYVESKACDADVAARVLAMINDDRPASGRVLVPVRSAAPAAPRSDEEHARLAKALELALAPRLDNLQKTLASGFASLGTALSKSARAASAEPAKGSNVDANAVAEATRAADCEGFYKSLLEGVRGALKVNGAGQ